MTLDELQRHWDAFGQQDPMWAILTDPSRKGRRWTAAEFFATGAAEVAGLMREAAALGLPRQRRRGLDFGCGLGRLTQALAAHVDHVVGLDVAPSMIAQARTFNQHGQRVDYRVLAAPPFEGIPDRAIDLVYTGRVLQHIAPEFSRAYISELARVLAPGGYLSFDVPSRWLDAPPLPPGALSAGTYAAAIEVMTHEVTGAGGRVSVDLRLTNAGTAEWPVGAPLNVGNHWLTSDGDIVVADDERVAVPLPLGPGQSAAVRFTTSLPVRRDAHVLELDVVHEGVAWFAWFGSPTARIAVGETRPAGLRPGAAAPVEPAPLPPAPATAFEPVMEMHGVPRREVEALLQAAGVRVLQVRPEGHCGLRWEAFRYDVTAD